MDLYAEFYPLAVEMLTEFGAAATLTGPAPAAPTLVTKRAGRATTSTNMPQNRPTRAAVGPVEVQGVDGRLIRSTVATTLHEPREGDTLTMGANSWTIGTVTRIAPQGKPIVFMSEVS